MNKTRIKDMISIIVPVYNAEPFLKRCIKSILNQSYQNLELILIDDGSKDASGTICDEFKAVDDRITVIHQANGGQSKARNTGIEASIGEYIGFVDSDDYVELTMYEELIQAIKKNKSSKIAACGIFKSFEDDRYSVLKNETRPLIQTDDALIEILTDGQIGIGVWSKLYYWKCFNNVRFPEGETNEDAAILIDTMSHTDSVACTGNPSYYYCIHKGSQSTTLDESRVKTYEKNAQQIQEKVSLRYPTAKDAAQVYKINQVLSIWKYMKINKYSKSECRDYLKQLETPSWRVYKHLSNKRKLMYIYCKLFG